MGQHRVWTLPAALILAGALALGQESRGTIRGQVTDTSGAVVPGASVTATNVATNVSVENRTNTAGEYNLSYVLPGTYRLSVSADGFKVAARNDIDLRVNDRLQVDFVLEVGATTERVDVTAEAPILETATASIGQVVDARRIAELPIPYGSPLTLMYLTPGVTNTYARGMARQLPSAIAPISTTMNVNGAPMGSTEFTVDGIPNTQTGNADRGVGVASSPPADMVQEFKLETPFDASVGHTSGTIMNVSLKTGANRLHGTAFWFHKNPSWDANGFFANRAGQGKANYYFDRWGGTFSGPVYIPRLYNGADRTFFSYGYEGFHINERVGFTGTVPDPRNYGGDFSNLLALGLQYQIYDPATARPAPGGRITRDPFPGNVIPPSRIDPIAKRILEFYPKPNNTARPDGVNNYTAQDRPYPEIYYTHIARVDHNLSAKQRMYARLSVMNRTTGPYRDNWDGPGSGNRAKVNLKQIALDDVYVLSPTVVLNVRYGYARFPHVHFPRVLDTDSTALGFPDATAKLLSARHAMFPQIGVAGLSAMGNEAADYLKNDVHSLFASAVKQAGSHTLKIGTDLRAYRENVYMYGKPGGNFTFDTTYTRGPFDNSPASPGGMGQGLAALLLGRPTGGSIDWNDNQAIQSTYYAAYIHDNWRAARRLSLDIGLRWEYEGPVTERFDRAVRGFDPSAQQQIERTAAARYAAAPDGALPASQFRLRGGLLFAGRGGQPRGFWDRSFGTFAPRVGLAYEIVPKTVLRAGFGIFPIQIGQPAQARAIQTGFNQSTPLVASLDGGLTFAASLANPFPDGVQPPLGASMGTETYLGRGLSFYSTEARIPESARWDFNVQRMLPGSTLLEVGYGGSKNVRLRAARELNPVPNDRLSRTGVRDQATIDYLGANVPNPMEGLLPGTGLNGKTIARSQLLKPFPQYGDITIQDYQGYSWYHSLRVRAERRFSRGFTAMLGYSLSKTMEATTYMNSADPSPYRTISAIDRPHHLSFSGIAELPFGRGRHFGGNWGRATDALLGGWQIGPVWQLSSGEPLSFGNIIFNGDLNDIPLSGSERSVERWFNTDAGFERNASRQLASNYRTFPLRLSGVRSGLYNQWDISALKNFQVREGVRIQFRGEFLNAFNHPNGFAPPNTSPTNSAFGQVTDIYALPRNIQLGLKLIF